VPDQLERLQRALRERYAIERELGAGGMATVYLAVDLKHDRRVAIKVLHPELAATIGAERFEREIRLAAKLQHPHILGLYDSGHADGLLFYVMPFVEGESLRDRLVREGQLPVDDAIQIALEIADALRYAHTHGIVHRDIKPENVLLSGGHALVADFGIARAASEGAGAKLTQTGVAVGTPVYMAPEQAVGESVGPTADLYSLGAVLYEMLAGEPPFAGKSAQAIMARHAMENVPSVRVVRPTVPEEVEEAIFAAMAKVPADRPQSAGQFAELLGVPIGATAARRAAIRATAARRAPTSARLVSVQPAALRWRRWWVVASGVMALAGTAWLVWLFAAGTSRDGGGNRGSVTELGLSPRRIAVLYFEDLSPDGELGAAADGLTEGLIAALGEQRGISVVSRNGVAQFRRTSIARDSIARALGAGTLIEGSLVPEGPARVRVSTRLVDGAGTDLGRRVSFVVPREQLFTAEDSVAREVSRTLRGWLGAEIQLREGRSGTRSIAAWTLYNRAEQQRKAAERVARTSPDTAAELLAAADSMLAAAYQADPQWTNPLVLRGEAALQRGRIARTVSERAEWIAAGLGYAEQALQLRPTDARALALRGSLRYAEWRLARTPDPVARGQLLAAAKQDLQAATRSDPTLAGAYATLSQLHYEEKDVFAALTSARNAYEADAYLGFADAILDRLFWASYDTDQFAEAAKWCEEGARRFPADVRFGSCQLWLLLTRDARPNVDLAWELARRVDSLAPAPTRLFQSHVARMVVGGVIGRAALVGPGGPGRAALLDSADRVLVRARADPEVDPRQELLGYEAIMRALMEQPDQAIELLRRYVALNPDHSFEVGGNVHWWWRSLRGNPRFEAVMARRR
jgi:serine/threonine-protein kinase